MTDREQKILTALSTGPQTYTELWLRFKTHTFWPIIEEMVKRGDVIKTMTDNGAVYKLKDTK